MGCIARLGCLTLLAILAVVGWLTRDRWMGMLRGGDDAVVTSAAPVWAPLTDEGAARARRQIQGLTRPSGPAFANLRGADLASYVFQSLSRQLPPSADSTEAAVVGDQLVVRTSVRLSDLGGPGVLGPLAGMMGDRERMQFGGTVRVLRPGLGEFQVRELRLRDFRAPAGMIPRLVARMRRGTMPEGLSPSGIPVEIPRAIGDVRIANGRVTLYKAIP
jgi:hypothetical protein